ncbi:MAG: hypothetical protein EOP84_26325 [Verrucomicrobiaceae bacterium]|nr:MAG: hypothetical protein EOP84_26325 [Verrucomicrobiaceae bacterium]
MVHYSFVSAPAPSRLGQLWRQRRFRLLLFLVAALIFIAGLTAGGFQLWAQWDAKQAIEPRGGLPFLKRVELEVPSYRQNDPRWGDDFLGPTEGTIGAEGCAVSSAAMVLSSYGIDTDPQRLNSFLNEREGYTPQGWIYWEKAAELAPDKVRHVYEDLPSYRLIDTNLLRGNPVIVRLRQPGGMTHFVVVAGKDGFDYLTRDPGAGAAKGLYPLKEYGSKIEALRFYERL